MKNLAATEHAGIPLIDHPLGMMNSTVATSCPPTARTTRTAARKPVEMRMQRVLTPRQKDRFQGIMCPEVLRRQVKSGPPRSEA